MDITRKLIIESFRPVNDVISFALRCSQMIAAGKQKDAKKELLEYHERADHAPVRLIASPDLDRVVLHVKAYGETDHSVEAAEALSKIPNLQSLSLDGDGVCDLAQFSKMTQLKELAVFQPNACHYEEVLQLSDLESLTLQSSNLPKVDFIRTLPKLKSLNISLREDNDYTWLGQMDQLERLAISGCKNGLGVVAGLTGLKHLWFNSLGDSMVDLSPIEGFTELRTLELHCATCIDLQPLAKCRKLERLLICANSVTSTWVLDGLSNLSDCQIL